MKTPSSRVAFASQKGGVGKTTTVLNVAACVASLGRVLVADTDPLGACAASLGLEPDPGVREVLPGVDLLWAPQADGDQVNAKIQAAVSSGPYALILVDTPPLRGLRARVVLQECDQVVLVLRATPLSVRSLPTFLGAVRGLRRAGGRPSLRGAVIGEAPGAPEAWAVGMEQLLGPKALQPRIPYDEAAGASLLARRPITASAPESPAGRAYRALAVALFPALSAPESDAREPRQAGPSQVASVRSVFG